MLMLKAYGGRGRKSKSIPVHLQRRVKISWGNFEATRRHVQAYMVCLAFLLSKEI